MYFSLSVWPTSLSMGISRSAHVAADGVISFFLMAKAVAPTPVFSPGKSHGEDPGGLPSMGSHFTFSFHFHALEKEMATHSSVLAWRIPGTAEPGGLLSMGSHRVGHD